MRHLPVLQWLRAALLMAAVTAALAFPQAGHAALEPLGTPSCGQLGQLACTLFTNEWWQTGSGTGCDRGLKEEWSWSGIHCVNDQRFQAQVNAWATNALRLQRELQAGLPLNQLTLLGGHNAFNNRNDGYSRGGEQWENQIYSATDQLRMGIRTLSLDVHWFNEALRLCHGMDVRIADHIPGAPEEWVVHHAGCSPWDRPYFQIIEELNQWLRKPENSQEVVFLELETYTDGHNAELIAPIQAYVADLVFRPSMMPTEAAFPDSAETRLPSLNEIRAQGKRLVIIGGNDLGNDLFIPSLPSGPAWPSGGAKNFVASPCGYVNNGSFTPIDPTYQNTTRRNVVSEDSTVYELEVLGYQFKLYWNGPESIGVITHEKLRELTACNVTGISLDQVTPGKIQHAIWSWDVNQPSNSNNEDCAAMLESGRWSATSCGAVRRFACRHSEDTSDWRVTTAAGEWQQGVSQCASEYPGYQFAVPRTGYENQRLAAAAQGENVWLYLNDTAVEGVWSSSGAVADTVELRSLGKCMDDSSGNASSGANVQLWDCDGGSRQRWVLPGDGTIRSALNTNKCLDLVGGNTQNGTRLALWDCHGGGNQRWIVSGSSLRTALNRNKGVDVSGGNTANGTRIQLWDSHGGSNQQWTQVP
ncbi:MAG TPA: RICIN domain-containing protein [Hyalangium sp.]|nr:RICIN domain-containing protein [Hyalangium sp.]